MSSDQGAVYDPEELALLGQVLDRVVRALPPNQRTSHHRATIARNILACAARGERDPIQLELAASIDPDINFAA